MFLVVSLAIGAFTIGATQRYLAGQADAELRATVERVEHTGDLPSTAPAPPSRGGTPTDRNGRPGGPPGAAGPSSSLTVVISDGTVVTSRAVSLTNQQVTLSSEQIATLLSAELGETPQELDLGSQLGTYRLVQAESPDGETVFAGLRTGAVDDTVRAVATLVGIGILLGTLLVAALGSLLIRRNLAPLQRVAGTATQVSRLQLDSGDVALAVRVPTEDTNPSTEVGAVGLALNNMLDNVEGALQARQESESRIRRFVADASHELRTPLASIRGYAELSRREREPVPAGITHALSRVESESIRMQGLVEDLLLLARLDSGRPLEREPVDLTMLIINAVSDAHAAAPDHVWNVDLPDEPIEVPGDAARLHQVLANLLANARTHTPPGTTVVTSLRAERDSAGDWARLTVTDDGPGIPDELQARVFERFTRGDEARTRASGSTGLGLSIVSAVAQAHGGRVEVESRPGHTAMSVVLPA